MSKAPPAKSSPFITHLQDLARRDDRGALATLRRGLASEPGQAHEMHPYVAPFLPDEPWTWRNRCYYIVAALFAVHPKSGPVGDLGDTFRRLAQASDSESVQRRFMALLKCNRDDLFGHLRQAVSLAASHDVPINWDRLFRDIQYWSTEEGWVQRRWAQSFWGGSAAETSSESEETS